MNWPRSRILTLFVLFLLSIFRPNYAGEVTPKLDLEEVAKYGLTSLLVPKNFAPVFSRYPNWRGKLEFGANFQGVQVLEDGDKITEQLNIDALEVFVELDILATEAQESLIFKSSLMEMSSLVDQVGIPAGDNIFDRIEVVQSDFEFSNEVPTVFFLSFNQCGACHVLKSKIISHLSNGQFSEEAIERLNITIVDLSGPDGQGIVEDFALRTVLEELNYQNSGRIKYPTLGYWDGEKILSWSESNSVIETLFFPETIK